MDLRNPDGGKESVRSAADRYVRRYGTPRAALRAASLVARGFRGIEGYPLHGAFWDAVVTELVQRYTPTRRDWAKDPL